MSRMLTIFKIDIHLLIHLKSYLGLVPFRTYPFKSVSSNDPYTSSTNTLTFKAAQFVFLFCNSKNHVDNIHCQLKSKYSNNFRDTYSP